MTCVVVISDLHVGSVVGLWPVGAILEGGGRYQLNKYQEWLMECWQAMCEDIATISPKPTLVINGDIIQGKSWRDGQLITNRGDIQANAAELLLAPLMELVGERYVIRGTEWHEGRCSEDVSRLARSIGAVQNPTTGQYTQWELFLEWADNTDVIHFAHHIGTSSVPWYEATVPLRDTLLLLSELVREYQDEMPNVKLVVRSHRHRHVYVREDVGVVVTPAWQLKTAFGYRKATSMLPHIGYVKITHNGKRFEVDEEKFPLPLPSVRKLSNEC